MNNNDFRLLSLTAQVRGEYLAEIRELARESYLRREIGSEEEFENLWIKAFFAEESDKPAN
ncbi:MAG TPA: hypothetical protein VN920_11240 [Pyrinomonadaceae bacterium]|nr:hypothetical protein [Pyrinomonadaceae bacterium]